MTNQPCGGHDAWELLAAADALHALDPDEERQFLDHLDGCPGCAVSLDGYAFVAAQLGSLALTESDEIPAWDRMRAGLYLQPRPTVVTFDRQRARRRGASRVLAAAAAVAGLTAGGIAVWGVSRDGDRHAARTVAALSACEREADCRIVRLHNPDGTNPAAVMVNTDRVTLVPLAMGDAPAGRTYVLWQLPRDGGPILIAEFRDTARETASALLPSDYADTAAFAVSEESIRVTPLRPTRVLAVGTAT